MGFMDNYGVGANMGVQNFLDAFYRGDESRQKWAQIDEQKKYRSMQEQLMQQQVEQMNRQKEQEAGTSQYIQQALAPQATGPTPTQQYMGRVQGLMREPSGIDFAKSGNLANAPQQAQAQAMAEARGGAFPQQMAAPKLDIKTFLMKLAEKNPDKAEKYATALAGLERTDMTDMMKMMMLRETIGSKEKIADQAVEVKKEIADDRNQTLKILKVLGGSVQKPPPGYRSTGDGNLEAIPGGPADNKLHQKYVTETASLDSMVSEMDRLALQANMIKKHPGLGGITGIPGKFPNIPGGAAANVEAQLGTLKSQTAFSVLQAMRNASKTGGALGQVSDKEGQLLQDNLASLEKAQSKEAFQKSLQQIVDYTENAKQRLRKAYTAQWENKAGETTKRFVIKQVR